MQSIETIIQKIEKLKNKNNPEGALQVALEGLKVHMNDYRLYEELADIYLFQNNLDKAEEVLHYARELHPNSGTGIYLQGYIQMEKGDFEQAISTFEKVNKLFPNNPEILQNIGWSHVMIGNMQKGLALLQRAHHLDDKNEHIMQLLVTAKILAEEQNSTSLPS